MSDEPKINSAIGILCNKNGVTFYKDNNSVYRLQLPAGNIIRYTDAIIPQFVLNGDFYTIYYDKNNQSRKYIKIDIDSNGYIRRDNIDINNIIINNNISIAFLYSMDYSKIFYLSFGEIITFDGNEFKKLKGDYNYFFSRNMERQELGDKIMMIDNDKIYYLDLTNMNISSYDMPSKEEFKKSKLDNVTFYTSVVDDDIYIIFKGSDYNTGKNVYGKILPNGSVVYALSEDEIKSLHYDRKVCRPTIMRKQI